MKPGNLTILLRPDDLQSGPSGEWLLHFANNLKLVSRRVNAGLTDIRGITPKDKDARQLLKTADCSLVFLHQTWFNDDLYTGFIEDNIPGGKEVAGKVVLVNTSPGIREIHTGKLKQFASCSFSESKAFKQEAGFIDDTDPAYWSKMLDLVMEIKQTKKPDTGIIYLAQTESGLSPVYDTIRRELMEQGFRVVPDTDLLGHQKDMRSLIRDSMDHSRLAIHLLGNDYGDLVEGESRSISELQVRVIGEYLEAVERGEIQSHQHGISRLIWVDPDFNPSDERQGEFVEVLKRNIEKLHRTEIVQNPLELFKTLVIKKLKQEDLEAARLETDISQDKKELYIIHHRSDERDAGELARRLVAEGLDIAFLDYSKEQTHLLKEHKRNLRNCDASVVYYGNRNRPWLRSKIMDLLKAPGFGRTKPLELRQVLVAGEDGLDDFSLPREIGREREKDPGKAAASLLKQLKL
jgi:hypothetical protein